MGSRFSVKELSRDTYQDFSLLARRQGGCWCMYYQRARPVRSRSTAEWARTNSRDKRKLVRQGRSHAILVYDGSRPVGWCQYGPEEELPRIDAGRFYRAAKMPAQGRRLWRITCFFVDRDYRRKGVAGAALTAALESIKKQGGGVVEAYPVVSKKMVAVPEWLWFGTPRMFEHEGFVRVGPLGTSRVLMQKSVGR
ncbi:MAG: GNAT family N-acetyltransferase [Nitrososphaerota archaeon]|nr:GNAT family N-acetyltransferase [Nitrososphaerota archaeon]